MDLRLWPWIWGSSLEALDRRYQAFGLWSLCFKPWSLGLSLGADLEVLSTGSGLRIKAQALEHRLTLCSIGSSLEAQIPVLDLGVRLDTALIQLFSKKRSSQENVLHWFNSLEKKCWIFNFFSRSTFFQAKSFFLSPVESGSKKKQKKTFRVSEKNLNRLLQSSEFSFLVPKNE